MFDCNIRDNKTYGMIAGIVNVSKIWKNKIKFMGLNLVFNSILQFQAKSAHPCACLSACQKRATTSSTYPLPVEMLT